MEEIELQATKIGPKGPWEHLDDCFLFNCSLNAEFLIADWSNDTQEEGVLVFWMTKPQRSLWFALVKEKNNNKLIQCNEIIILSLEILKFLASDNLSICRYLNIPWAFFERAVWLWAPDSHNMRDYWHESFRRLRLCVNFSSNYCTTIQLLKPLSGIHAL